MTEFKGEDGEGLRRSGAAAGMWETGGRSPAGTKYGGGGWLGPFWPFLFLLPRGDSYRKSSFSTEGFLSWLDLRTCGLGEMAAVRGYESQCFIQSPEEAALGGPGRRLKASAGNASRPIFTQLTLCSELWVSNLGAQHNHWGAWCSNPDSQAPAPPPPPEGGGAGLCMLTNSHPGAGHGFASLVTTVEP